MCGYVYKYLPFMMTKQSANLHAPSLLIMHAAVTWVNVPSLPGLHIHPKEEKRRPERQPNFKGETILAICKKHLWRKGRRQQDKVIINLARPRTRR
jgi:hypothetical protein